MVQFQEHVHPYPLLLFPNPIKSPVSILIHHIYVWILCKHVDYNIHHLQIVFRDREEGKEETKVDH